MDKIKKGLSSMAKKHSRIGNRTAAALIQYFGSAQAVLMQMKSYTNARE